ncbi:methyltransferase [Psittacicella hinzii]|uniref:Ribosomal RNA small subunit methyltransferase C n=1 Tax=Psittacicella hinzii TaxID=2028575 RepID=A0A3A1YCF7_9GAMM|nr:methyltransferase [Psittacicella hinzii]RIY34868.1 hypothetical protein CKF58_07540 [Psittacicella hinzii]
MYKLSPELKVLERNQGYFTKAKGIVLLGAVEATHLADFLTLLEPTQKLAVYTNQEYTFKQMHELATKRGYKSITNLWPESQTCPLFTQAELDVKEIALAYAYPLEITAPYLQAQGYAQETSVQALTHKLTELPIINGKERFIFSHQEQGALARLIQLSQADTFVMFWPKSKEEFLVLIQALAQALTHLQLNLNQLNFFFLGSNDSGIKTIESLLTGSTQVIDNAGRWRLYTYQGDLTASNKLSAKVKAHKVELTSGNIYNLPGVFSSDKLDKGTELLLTTYQDLNAAHNQHLLSLIRTYNKKLNQATNPQINFLDYGAGAGVITQFFMHLMQQQITNSEVQMRWDLIDVSAAALLCSNLNLSTHLNAQTQLNLVASASINQALEQGLPEVYYREIVTNPPFHQGKEQTFAITETLIKQAKARLHQDGALRLVANSGLPYLPMLEQHFKHVQIIAKANGFTVYLAKH